MPLYILYSQLDFIGMAVITAEKSWGLKKNRKKIYLSILNSICESQCFGEEAVDFLLCSCGTSNSLHLRKPRCIFDSKQTVPYKICSDIAEFSIFLCFFLPENSVPHGEMADIRDKCNWR